MHNERTLTFQQLITIRRAAEDACMAANPRLKSFVDTVAHPLNIIALCNMATRQEQEHTPVYTYCSEQETECANCGKRKHTPLRVDFMGGYVCLTCIDRQVGRPRPGYVFLPEKLSSAQLDMILGALNLADDFSNRMLLEQALTELVDGVTINHA